MAGFTDRVRQELAQVETAGRSEERGQLAGVLFLGGSLHLRSGRLVLEVTTSSGAVARWVFRAVRGRGADPQLEVHAPGGLQEGSRYRLVIRDGAPDLGRAVGVIDDDGRPRGAPPGGVLDDGASRTGFARGALMIAGSFSSPGRDPHLEVAASREDVARALTRALGAVADGTDPGVSSSGGRHRVVIKSGETIGRVLAGLGASRAFLEWDDARLRRHLRGEANRLANADAANVRRAVRAAAAQVRSVESVIERAGWEALDEELREVALVRLANPEATLAELGELCDPPLSKSSVHRRLRRIDQLRDDRDERG